MALLNVLFNTTSIDTFSLSLMELTIIVNIIVQHPLVHDMLQVYNHNNIQHEVPYCRAVNQSRHVEHISAGGSVGQDDKA